MRSVIIPVFFLANLIPGIDETFIITLRYLVTISHDESSVCETLVTTSDFLYNLLRVFVFWHWKYFDDLSTHTNLVAKNEDESESIQPAEVLEKVSLSLGLMSQLIKNNDAAKETLRGISKSNAPRDDRDCDRLLSRMQIYPRAVLPPILVPKCASVLSRYLAFVYWYTSSTSLWTT